MDRSSQAAFDVYWRCVRERLEHDFDRRLAQFFDAIPAADQSVVRDVLRGGKRLRGCVVILMNEALGGSPGAAFTRALAVECVQAASLIHDDFVDGDTSRRDRAATWTVLGPRRAVLLGDLMFATALSRAAELGREDGVVMARAIATMAAGAFQEPLATSDPARDAGPLAARLYPRLVHLKTGVLFGAAAQLGALAAEVSAPVAAHAFAYGACIGEAYQIADDLQDWLAAPPTAAQCPLLAPAVWHFCADGEAAERFGVPTPEHAERLRPLLRNRMEAAIGHRLQRAVAAADLLASGPHVGLLRAAPYAIVRAMARGGP
ncbi:polyprenyl synthetase family protein [Ramlibacter sp. AN1015]|uniref:polyprenyl synthetase family protein n=1 Tax=Ramlibacter sp. AN1015 TaxID=3133428 RepID=UPI0030C0E227